MFRRLATTTTLVAMVAVGLGACAPPGPEPTRTPADPSATPTQTPDLSEVARATYEAYLQTTLELTSATDPSVQPLLDFATPAQAAFALSEVQVAIAEGLALEGQWRVPEVQLIDDSPSAPVAVACPDNSGVIVIDQATGESTTPTPTIARLVTFERADRLLVASVGEAPEGLAPCN